MTTNTSLIDPGEVDSKSPLKKSTVAWAIGLLVGLALLGIYGPKWISTVPATAEAPKTSSQPSGSAAQIEAEAARAAGNQAARDRAAQEAAANHARDTQQSPTSAASASARATPSKGGVTPTSNSVALPQADPAAAAEIEAAARTSKSLVVDASPAMDALKKGTSAVSPGAVNANSDPSVDSAAFQAALAGGAGQQRSPGADRLNALLSAQGEAGAARDPNRDWVKEFAGRKPSAAIQPTLPGTQYTLIQGKVIPAVLGKSLNSDLPGDITAFTTTDIYDSISGQWLLIPKGSQLVGEYANAPKAGQVRLMFAFSRIVLPNGMSFALPGNKGQDGSGMSGLEGDVNNHYLKRFASAFFVAVLAQKYDNQQVSGTVIQPAGPQTAVGQVLAEIAKSDLNRNRDIPPTITIPSGTRINVQVAADMEFPHAYPTKR